MVARSVDPGRRLYRWEPALDVHLAPATIPGQLRELEKRAIGLLARLVPPRGNIVEVGSLLGLSAWLWSRNADPTVSIYCVDPWEKAGRGFQKWADQFGQQFGIDQFRRNVADCRNVVAVQGFSPDDFQKWARPVSLYFEDAVHADPVLSRNLAFWGSHLTPQGILCGHDYIYASPDVIAAVDRLAEQTGRRRGLVQSLWYLLPPEIENAEDEPRRSVVAALAALNTPPLPRPPG
jgi:hypothetical protein